MRFRQNKLAALAVFALLMAALFAVTSAGAAQSDRRLAQDAGIDLLPGKPVTGLQTVAGSGFTSNTYTCDADGWATNKAAAAFSKNESFCVMGTYTSDDPNETRSLIAVWQDGNGEHQLALGKDVQPGEEMHWLFGYDDPSEHGANIGTVTVKDYDTCEVLGVYPLEILDQPNDLVFSGDTYQCDADQYPIGEPVSDFEKGESVCVSGAISHGQPGAAVTLDFIWMDGFDNETIVSVENVTTATVAQVYFYYKYPENVVPNSGTVTVKDVGSGRILATFPIHYYDGSSSDMHDFAPLAFDGNTYQCDEDFYSTGSPTSQFAADQNICLSGTRVGGDPSKTVPVIFDWEDGNGSSTLLLDGAMAQGDQADWYFYYYNPASIAANQGKIEVRDFDTCKVLQSYPVNITEVQPTRTLDAGTGL